jgi:prepilin-type N-terminal cleavage/methylation domain-containing protein
MKEYRHTSGGRRAFTLVELLVTIGIVSIMALLVVSVISGNQAKARDSHRLFDVAYYYQAMSEYSSENSTYFVSSKSQGGCAASAAAPLPPGHIYSISGNGCVGAWGNSSGLISAKGSAYAEQGYNPTASIADALIEDGYISRPVDDPRVPKILNYPNYYLSICTAKGGIATSINEAVKFSVRAALEQPTDGQLHSEQIQCGGIASGL